MAANPSLEAFEAELKKYMAIETEIASIPSVYNIGEHGLEGPAGHAVLTQRQGA